MFLKKVLLLSTSYFFKVFSQKCFIQTDITNSNNLFSYNGNVYDITNYNHPGGKTLQMKTVGDSLEKYVNQQSYSFHLTSNKFKNDLQNIYVGVLKDNCNTLPAVVPTLPVTTALQETTSVVPTLPVTTITDTTISIYDPSFPSPTSIYDTSLPHVINDTTLPTNFTGNGESPFTSQTNNNTNNLLFAVNNSSILNYNLFFLYYIVAIVFIMF